MKKVLFSLFSLLLVPYLAFADWDADGVTAVNTVAANITVIDGNFQALEAGTAILPILTDGTDSITIGSNAIVSDTDNTIDLGSSTYEFKDLYVDGVAYIDQLSLSGSGSPLAAFTNTGTNHGMYLTQTGVLSSGYHALRLYSNAVQVNSALANFEMDHASSTSDLLRLDNDGTGKALYILQDGVLASDKNALYVTSNAEQDASNLIKFHQDNASSDAAVFFITNDSTAPSIEDDSGANLTAAGVWTNSSSREKKENFTDVNVLNRLMSIPIQKYNYKNDSLKYITPCAEDFHEAFGTGDEKSLSAGTTAGVALRGLQELNAKVIELEKRIEELEK